MVSSPASRARIAAGHMHEGASSSGRGARGRCPRHCAAADSDAVVTIQRDAQHRAHQQRADAAKVLCQPIEAIGVPRQLARDCGAARHALGARRLEDLCARVARQCGPAAARLPPQRNLRQNQAGDGDGGGEGSGEDGGEGEGEGGSGDGGGAGGGAAVVVGAREVGARAAGARAAPASAMQMPGAPEASCSWRLRLPHAPASLGQSAAWAAVAGNAGLVVFDLRAG